jgi:hypothetical protein
MVHLTAALSLLLSSFLLSTHSHIIMKEPSNGGVDTEPAKQLCKGTKGKHATPLKAGSSLRVQLSGTATHEGGGCQFGLSYDGGKTFTLLMTTDDKCPMTQQYDVPIPADAPSCTNCVFAWGWIPRQSGAPEYYMNCAEVQVQGAASGGSLKGPQMQFFNMPGFQNVHYDNPQKSKTIGLTERFGEYRAGNGGQVQGPVTPPAPSVPSPSVPSYPSADPVATPLPAPVSVSVPDPAPTPASSASNPSYSANTGNSVSSAVNNDPLADAKASLQRMTDLQSAIAAQQTARNNAAMEKNKNSLLEMIALQEGMQKTNY